MEKYDKLSNMSANWNKILKIPAKPNLPSDKQMQRIIKKLFSDLSCVGRYSKN